MRNYFFIFLSTLLFVSTGCDSTTTTLDEEEQPHEIADKPRAPFNTEDVWHHTQYINIQATIETNTSTPMVTLDIDFTKTITSDEVKHFQIYIDSDNNASTGFSGGQDHYEIIGADYMIEEGQLFKSTSTTAWTWALNTCCIPNYTETKSKDGLLSIKSTFKAKSMFSDIIETKILNISIEPVDYQWQDTNHFIQTQTVTLIP